MTQFLEGFNLKAGPQQFSLPEEQLQHFLSSVSDCICFDPTDENGTIIFSK